LIPGDGIGPEISESIKVTVHTPHSLFFTL